MDKVNSEDTMPPLSAHLHKKLFFTVKNLVWICIFIAIFGLPKGGLQEQYICNFVVYNVLFVTVWNLQGPAVAFLPRVTPGALTSPLLPGLVGLVQTTPGKRSVLSIATYLAYVAALTWAMVFPITDQLVQVLCGMCATALVFDVGLMGFTSCDSVVMMFCFLFRDPIWGCQVVLLMMWVGNGLGKATPAWKWVISGIFKHSLMASCLPHRMWKWCFLDFSNSDKPTPSLFSRFLAWLGVGLEIIFPIFCMFPSGTLLWSIGVYGMILYHLFICATDNGLLWQWNLKSIVNTGLLFFFKDFSFPADHYEATFVIVMCVAPALLGSCFRLFVPTFLGHFEGTWNHRDGIILVRKSALGNLKKLKAYLNPLYPPFLPQDCGGKSGSPEHTYMLLARLGGAWNAGNNHCLPTWRGLIAILEKWFSDTGFSPDDFVCIPALVFNNAVLGGEYRMGWLWFRECYRTALLDVCEFQQNEFYIVQTEPVHVMPPYVVQYRIFDVSQGPLKADISATVPYEVLEENNSCDIYLQPEWVGNERSIRGTFLSTYY
jgi:hypothetical protein